MSETSAGHLALRVEGLHPRDVSFFFERQTKRTGLSLVAAAAFDMAIAVLVIATGRSSPVQAPDSFNGRMAANIVWIAERGSGGGGGGGGNQMRDPPRRAELPGRDEFTVPVEKTPAPDARFKDEPDPVSPLMIPAQALASSLNSSIGILDAAPPSSSQGPGLRDGAGTGDGSGIGPGPGSGLGPGEQQGVGGERYTPGSGVTPPVALYLPKPHYTADAMRARVQGSVRLECVVETNGFCAKARIVRSLDPTFGLDQEALSAARLFRFRPGTRMGEPVPVLVTIELSFSLH